MLYKTGNKYSIRLFNLSGKNIRCMYIYIQNNINTFGKHIIYSIPKASPDLKMVIIVLQQAMSYLSNII